MNQCCRELKAFLEAIHADPGDLKVRKIYADWLDDHDCPEEADFQRKFDLELYNAEHYLRDFAARYDEYYGDWEAMARAILKDNAYCFSSDYGPDEANSSRFHNALRVVAERKFKCPVPDLDEASFRCSC